MYSHIQKTGRAKSVPHDSYGCNFVLKQWCHPPLSHFTALCLWTSPSLCSPIPASHFQAAPPSHQHIGHTQRRYGISLITKSIWSGLTNSEESGEGGWEREIMRDQCGRLTINWIGGGRMRSLKNAFFFFFIKMGVPSIREGFIRHTDAHTCVHSQTRL